MIFYQKTLNYVEKELLKDSLLLKHFRPEEFKLHSFYFRGYPAVTSLDEALDIIEKKRLSLINKYQHHFIVFDLEFDQGLDVDSIRKLGNHLADTFNETFNNDLFIISLVYENGSKILSNIIISDMEISLDKSSETHLTSDMIDQIMEEALGDEYDIWLREHAIYVFNSDSKEEHLAYDGCYHVYGRIMRHLL